VAGAVEDALPGRTAAVGALPLDAPAVWRLSAARGTSHTEGVE
jgi:hypothetical protein